MVKFWKDFGQFWTKNADISKNSPEKAWGLAETRYKSVFLETRYKGYTLCKVSGF